jgi:phosphate-selective porin OprO/OprP
VLAVGLAVGLAGLTARAQGQTADPTLEALKARLDALERQNKDLLQKIESGTPISAYRPEDTAKDAKADERTKKLIGDYIQERETKAKAKADADKEAKAAEGYEVGTSLGMTARWNPLQGFTVETANRDFVAHFGGWVQNDYVWFNQTNALRAPSQLGDFQDGTYFRRVRIQADGTVWDVFEYNFIYALEQVQQGIPNLDEFWFGIRDVPILGTLRVGHQKVPQGFEGDNISSSRAMTFLERSSYSSSILQNENFGTGFLATSSFFDQRMTYMAMAYRQDNSTNGNNGTDFGDGQWGYTGRLTFLPIYEDKGRHLLHLGVSGTWRQNEHADSSLPAGVFGVAPQGGFGTPRQARLRAFLPFRDAIGDFGTSVVNNGAIQGLPGNANRFIDTGNLNSPSTAILAGELFYVLGPFSIQSEAAYSQLRDVSVPPTIPATRSQDRGFWGGYVQLAYTLTGENRAYDRRYGRLATSYFDNIYTPFWAVEDENGGVCCGRGAWEIAARYNYVNLNDGPIRGGVMGATEIGVNWYLNLHAKINFEYMFADRYDKGTIGVPARLAPSIVTGGGGSIPGNVQGFGMRFQFMF